MINTEYLKNLILSKKYLLLFVFLISLLSATVNDGVYLILSIAVLLCYILPIVVFKYIHDKKAVDTYFSLPLSRKELLVTGLLFCVLATIIPSGISYLVYNLIYESHSIPSAIGFNALVSVASTCLILFNTMLYQLANTEFDGIVMIGAYSLLPLAMLVVMEIFLETFVCGYAESSFEIIGYLSPAYLLSALFLKNYNTFHLELDILDWKYLLALIVFAIISFVIMYKLFPKRDVERAGTSSSKFFAYPFVIYTYTLLVLFGISSNYSYSYAGIFSFLEEFLVLYIITFALFVIAHFVYKRKFYFNIQLPIFYVIALAISLLFCTFARSTNGFGLANDYLLDSKNVLYEMNCPCVNQDIYEWFEKQTGEKVDYIDFYIKANNIDGDLTEKEITVMEKYRNIAIEQFYDKKNTEDYMNVSYISLNIRDVDHKVSRYYHFAKKIDLNTLLSLAKYDGIEVTVTCENGDYKLSKNEDLLVINRYNIDEEIKEAYYE